MAASDASFVFFAEHFNYSLVSAFDLKCSPVVIVKTSHKSKVSLYRNLKFTLQNYSEFFESFELLFFE